MAEFIKHKDCKKCGSSDGNAVYADGSTHCFVCHFTVPSNEWIEANSKTNFRNKNVKEQMEIKQKPAISQEEVQNIRESTTTKGNGFRGIRDDIYTKFAIRHSFDENDNVVEQYYPVTQDGQLVGFKIREVPKNFFSKGRTGVSCDLFMQFRFNRGGKYILLVEGELDALSAYQMIHDYNNARDSSGTYETAVCSSTTGAAGLKQFANQYKFLDQFDNIILAFDNDRAGKTATEEIVKYLPKGKVKMMSLRYKDANEYLMANDQKSFIYDFYNAKKQIPVGVLPSGELYDRIVNQSLTAKVPFPPFMRSLNEMFVGGIQLGHIVNIAADTGIGKTTLVNEMVYYWIFNSPHTVGIVSMELDAGQYGESLLSRHLSRKLSLIENPEDKVKYLETEKVKEQANILMFKEDGESRFYLLDNRDGSIEEIQNTIEELVVACGCKVIVLDPLQDILDGLSNEEQSLFLKWSKGFIKSHGVTFVFINHMRKTPAGQDGSDSEQNIMGSSTIIKSASANILLRRDKMSDDELIRNSTDILITKNRICGLTGPAGKIYYDNNTHTLHNLDDWLNSNS